MVRIQSILALGLVAAAAAPALGQVTPQPSRERARTFVYSVGPELAGQQRGRLGVSVDLRPDPATDSVGAKLAGVTPGGAADRAGVHAGDIVTRLNGTRLAVTDARSDDEDQEQSRPGLRLVNLASRLDPGDTVRLDVRRDGRPQTFTFVAEASDLDRVMGRMRASELTPQVMTGPGEIFLRAGINMPLSDLELVKVNPGLGEYFGTNDGLLVVDVGADSALGLRAGDVILTIGGRRPTSPPHAMRILGTYDGDEQVQFEVMRQKHRITVSGRMPRSHAGEWRVRPNSFEFTVPHLEGQPFLQLQEMAPSLERLPHMMNELLPRMRMEMQMPDQMRIMQPKSLVRVDGIV